MASAVWPFLVDCWMDSEGEAVNIATPKGTIASQILLKVLQVMDCLWRQIGGSEHLLPQFWESIQRHIVARFPFGRDSVSAFRHINLAFCELITTASERLRSSDTLVAFRTAASYLTSSLFVEVAGWTAVNGSVKMVLRIVGKALAWADPETARQLLQTFVSAQREIPPTSPCRLETVRFLSTITCDPSSRELFFTYLQPWILSLPELLWQLRGAGDFSAVRKIVKALVETSRKVLLMSDRSNLADFAASLEKALITTFCVTLPGKGEVLGLFSRAPEDIQRDLISLVFCNGCPKDKLLKAVVTCLNSGSYHHATGACSF